MNNHSFVDFECSNLNLKFGEKILFTDFNLYFNGPGIVMIEGDNGAGKSTLLKVLAGLIKVPKSTVEFSGVSILQAPVRDFSFLGTTSLGLLSEMTGKEHIELISKVMKLDNSLVNKKIEEFTKVEIFNEILIKPVSDFSQGMKQLLRLFLHLFFEPRIVFLDEPFLYLSPKIRDFIQEQIDLLATNTTVFITDQKNSWIPKSKLKTIVLGNS